MQNSSQLYKLFVLFIIGINLCGKEIIAQNRISYCSCEKVGISISTLSNYSNDSLFASSSSDSFSTHITFFNKSVDTVYLFNSYLQQSFLSSKYLHRIDFVNREYKISFLPLVPFLFTEYSDLLQTKNAIVGRNQVVYNFYKLLPQTSYSLTLPYQDLFLTNIKQRLAVKDFNVKSLNKFNNKVKFKAASLDKVPTQFSYYFEFAFYKSVSFLCDKSAYYIQEYQFDKQAKEFEVIKILFSPPAFITPQRTKK